MQAFAFQNKEDIVKVSSSGGAFLAIADALMKISKSAPVILGAAWSDDLKVVHESEDKKERYQKFSGSKYSQSFLSDSFATVKNALLNDKWVLFTGTPCQVDSLNKYLEKAGVERTRLYTMDLICNGTPPDKYWSDFKDWIEEKKKSKLIAVSFRDKKLGWIGYHMKLEFSDGRIYGDDYETRLYLRLYFSRFIMQKRCFSCQFASTKRVSDLTVGDFWGIQESLPNVPIGKGVSLILSSTEKGNEIIQSIRENAEKGSLIENCEPDTYLPYQVNLQKPAVKPKKYDAFAFDYAKMGFSSVVKKYGFYTLRGKARYKLVDVIKKLLKF